VVGGGGVEMEGGWGAILLSSAAEDYVVVVTAYDLGCPVPEPGFFSASIPRTFTSPTKTRAPWTFQPGRDALKESKRSESPPQKLRRADAFTRAKVFVSPSMRAEFYKQLWKDCALFWTRCGNTGRSLGLYRRREATMRGLYSSRGPLLCPS
jgi:hypothetical protein